MKKHIPLSSPSCYDPLLKYDTCRLLSNPFHLLSHQSPPSALFLPPTLFCPRPPPLPYSVPTLPPTLFWPSPLLYHIPHPLTPIETPFIPPPPLFMPLLSLSFLICPPSPLPPLPKSLWWVFWCLGEGKQVSVSVELNYVELGL